MTNRSLRFVLPALIASTALLAAACSSDGNGDGAEPEPETDGEEEATGFEGDLVGTFGITTGECADGGVTAGSYFKMVQPGGTVADGPFLENADSACGDPSFTPLEPGADDGLLTGDYQPSPDPAFDDDGNGIADAITLPTTFFAVNFSTATAEEDPQSGETVSPPSITASDGTLVGDTSAFGVFYGNELFNQGAPKPDGSLPGLTTEVSGTIDPDTGEYVLEWTSLIVGGPFNDFVGVWHLEGTFTA